MTTFRDLPTDPDPFDRGKVLDPIGRARDLASAALSKLSPAREPMEGLDIPLCCAFNLLADLPPSTIVGRIADSRVRLISHWRQLRRAEAEAAADPPVERIQTEIAAAAEAAAEVELRPGDIALPASWLARHQESTLAPPPLELTEVPDSPLFAPEPAASLIVDSPVAPEQPAARAALAASAESLLADDANGTDATKDSAVVGLERFLRQVQARTGQRQTEKTGESSPDQPASRRVAKVLDGEYSSRFGRTGTA